MYGGDFISTLDDITEYSLNLDSFLNPTIYKGRSAVEILICRLILLEPGTIETHPNMGVGISSKYRNMASSDLTELDNDIKDQITTYMPFIYGVEVKTAVLKKGILRIAIKANDELFALTFDSNKDNSALKIEKLDLESFA